MKTKWCILVFLMAATFARAQTNLTALLQQGLFEEQANRNLEAAISNYQSLATQFDQNRQLAATAIFRLGECYRMENKTNEAAAEYRRIVNEFSDQTTLATLSRQNLAGMGMSETSGAGKNVTDARGKERQTLKDEIKLAEQELESQEKKVSLGVSPADSVQATKMELLELEQQLAALDAKTSEGSANSDAALWDKIKNLSQTELESVLPTLVPDAELTTLLQQRDDAKTKLAALQTDYGPTSPEITKQKAVLDAIEKQIAEAIAGIKQALQMRAEISQPRFQERLQTIVAKASSDSTTDDEAQEIQRIQMMIQNSPDLINHTSGDDGTPLFSAASKDQLRVAAFLLDHGADVNTPAGTRGKIWDAWTPLMAAANYGHKAMVELLLSHAADINATDNFHRTALYYAIKNGFHAVVEVLLEHKADVNARDVNGTEPLFLAAQSGNVSLAGLLITNGAAIDAKNSHGVTPLCEACLGPPTTVKSGIVKILLAAGANPNAEDDSGRVPLSYIAEDGSPEMVKMLLNAKADPNGGKLDAPLLVAIHNRDTNSVELLLETGANPNALGEVNWDVFKNGSTSWAAGHPSETPLFLATSTKQFPMVQLLLKYKANPNDSQTDGTPVLFGALDDTNILAALLNAGGNANSRPPSGWWPLLDSAIWKTNATTVQLLLEHGADVNVRNDGNQNGFGNYTPLHFAAAQLADPKIFELLFEYHANPNVRGDDGKTPLDLLKAKQSSSEIPGNPGFTPPDQRALAVQLADLLRQHGALDNLPDWNSIKISRPADDFSETIYRKGTNDWNHFTLLELISRVYYNGAGKVPFPDFAHIVVIRPNPEGKASKRIEINLLNSTNGVDCSKDMTLEFGDTVEISERGHTLAEKDTWTIEQINEVFSFLKSKAGEVKLVVAGGQTIQLPLKDFEPEYCTIGDILRGSTAQNVLTSDSDLSRVKVTRRDAKTRKKSEWILDCANASVPTTGNNFRSRLQQMIQNASQPSSDLWLRDGDVIEVPEKR